MTARINQRLRDFSPRHGTLNLLLLLAASILFAAAFPNPVFRWGIPLVAYIALIPVVVLIRRVPLWASPFYGAIYGLVAYALFNYWLANFHPLAIFIVPVIYAGYFFVVFPALKIVDLSLPQSWRWLGQTVIWMAYEFWRTKFYLGYAYGIIGYSQTPLTPLIQIADTFGVWGVSLLVVVPSFYFGQKWLSRFEWKEGLANWTGGLVYGVVFVAVLAYGLIAPVDYSSARQWRVALVQQNIDPWVGGFRAYEKSLEALLRQSNAALSQDDPEIVVWSETSFVPSIDYHSRYREDQQRYELVRELLTYLEDQPVPFVLGNSDGRLVRNESGSLERVDYNSVFVYDGPEYLGTYRKIHLVPFTEHFPFERQLPWMHRMLLENDTHFWEKGTEYTVFETDGVRFSTPICFEDTFGYLSRDFVRAGADVIVNMTNDLWSFSEPAQMQHMEMAVFRAVENRRSMVRSTNGGMTTIIDPNGAIQAMLEPFVEEYLVGDVAVFTGRNTIYTRWGDWFAWLMVAATAIVIPLSIVILVLRRARRGSN